MHVSPFLARHRIVSLRSVVACAVVLGVLGCDNPAAPIEGGGDPENISRVTVTLTPTGSGTAQSSVIVDPDGAALPTAPLAPQGTLALTKGATYNGIITLLNDLDPRNVIDISAEVQKEANFHRFFYTLTCAGVTVPDASLDLDTQSPTKYPLGLKFQVVVATTAATSVGCSLRVELRHWEGAKGSGLGGAFDTDLNVTFPVTIN